VPTGKPNINITQIAQHGAAARRDQRQAVRVHEARAERSEEDAQAQYVPAHFRAA